MKNLEEKYQKSILVAIAIQKEGQATVEEIHEKIQEMFKKKQTPFSLTQKQIERECKKLQKKNLISTNFIQQDGVSELAYSPSKPLFSRGVEGMQFMDIVDSAEAKGLIEELDETKRANKGRLPDIRDYYRVEATWQVTDEIGVLGFMPFTKEGYLEHYRDDKKNIIFLPKHFRAYIRANQRIVSKCQLHNYLSYDYGRVKLNGNVGKVNGSACGLSKTEHFVLDGHQGRGRVIHEVIPKGSKISTTFRVPEKGGLTKAEFRKFLEDVAEQPIRGFGGASSQGFGRMKLIDFK